MCSSFIICAVTLSFSILLIFATTKGRWKTYPKNFTAPRKKKIKRDGSDSGAKRYTSKNIQTFLADENNGPLDAIVIGSGIGGLTCSALLARCGKRVLVLEQHDRAGGSTHVFEDKGFEFDTGVHYLGNVSKSQPILDMLTGPDRRIEFARMGTAENGYVYDAIVEKNGREWLIPSGENAYREMLVREFPAYEEQIARYLELVRRVASDDLFFKLKIARPAWLVRKLAEWLGVFDRFFDTALRRSAEDVIRDDCGIDDPRLLWLLTAQWGDHGTLPSRASFFMHASVVNHYLHEGGFFVSGGSGQIAANIIPTIEESGGAVFVCAEVASIIVDNDNGTVTGVKLGNGDVIRCGTVVSSAGFQNTVTKLLGGGATANQALTAFASGAEPSPTAMCLFVGIDDFNEMDRAVLPSHNIWSLYDSGKSHDVAQREYFADPLNPDCHMPCFIGFPCAKDPTWKRRYPNKGNAVIVSLAARDWFSEWADGRTDCKKRGGLYRAKKEKFARRMLEELYRHCPHLRGRVTHFDLGTMPTFEHYIRSHEGGIYGLGDRGARFSREGFRYLRPDLGSELSLRGLYLTGQDVTTLGFSGALMSGILTAMSIQGYGTLWDIVTGRNLISDLKMMIISPPN